MEKDLSDKIFQEVLFKEDEVGSVIKAHLHIEYHVNEILELLVPFPECLKPMELDYFGKVNLICALGVKAECKAPLLAMGNIRNKFAHSLSFKLGASEVNNLYKSLPEEDSAFLHKALKVTNNALDSSNRVDFRTLNPKAKFILIAISIREMVIALRNELVSKKI